MNLDDDLRRALKRTPAPPDFADRVLARVGEAPAKQTEGGRVIRASFGRKVRAMQWLAAAAAVVLLAGGGARYYERQQNIAEAKRIEAEIRLAMQITSGALARVQATLNEDR